MLHINIIAEANQAGMGRNVPLLREILEPAGHRISVHHNNPPEGVGGQVKRLTLAGKRRAMMLKQRIESAVPGKESSHAYDVNLFLEAVGDAWFPLARRNVLVPNQEWLFTAWLPSLPKIDLVLCKTHYAQRVFADLGCRSEFMGFTSVDRRLNPSHRPDYRKCLHVAGKSMQKGTRTLLEVWRRHPEWPVIDVVARRGQADGLAAENIRVHADFIAEDDLQRMQNEAGLQFFPSEAEGFGHSLVEPMGCHAVVLTTDGPPMNEMITPERGELAKYRASAPQNLGSNYYVDPDDLERKIAGLLAMSEAELRARGDRARAWFEANDAAFRHRVVELFTAIAEDRAGNPAPA